MLNFGENVEGDPIKRWWRREVGIRAFAVIAAITLIAFAIVLRSGVTGTKETATLKEFESIFDIDIGPNSPWFASGLNGDGAGFTLIAVDPFGYGVGQNLTYASYRYARAGYSWLSAAVAGGNERLVLAGLSAVGLASIAVIAWISVHLRVKRGLWAWCLILNPALYIGFVGDTAEPLALALLAIALMSGSSIAGLTLAVVRPTYATALANRFYLFIGIVALAVLFRLFWVLRFDGSFSEGARNLTFPLSGIMAEGSPLGWLVVSSGIATLIVGIRSRDLSWILSGLLALCLGSDVLVNPIHAVRAAGVLPVLWAFGPTRSSLSVCSTIGLRRTLENGTHL